MTTAIKLIRLLATVTGLVFLGFWLAGAGFPGLLVVTVILGVILTNIKLRGPDR